MNFPPMMTEGSSRAFKFASSMPSLGWEPVIIAFHTISGTEVEQWPFDVHYVGLEVSPSELSTEQLFRFVHGLPQKKLSFPKLGVNARLNAGVKGSGWKKDADTIAEHILHDNPDIEMIYAQGPPFTPHRLALELSEKHHLPVVFDCIGPFDDDKLEMMIMFSGHCVIMPTREKKEVFLRKYRGELAHDDITIVRNGFDPEAFQALGVKQGSGALMHWVFHIEMIGEKDLKAFFSGLSSFMESQPVARGAISLTFTGRGCAGIGRYLKKYGLNDLVGAGAVCSHLEELRLCRHADIFCVVLGKDKGSDGYVPERLYDVLGMHTPLAGVLPEGLTRQLLLDAGGRVASIDSTGEISGLLQDALYLWRSGQLPPVAESTVDRYRIRSAMQELLREMATRLPLA